MYPDTELLIDGKWGPAAGGKKIPVLNPATEEVIGHVAHAEKADLDRALAAADKAFNVWRKVAPFDRYKTLDVAFGVLAAGAEERITLYTGNDDHIVADLVTPLRIRTAGRDEVLRFKGGLLGHWSVWTRRAVELLDRVHGCVGSGSVPDEVLALDAMVTDCNSVIFDVANKFAGCIPGCHEVLRRQGLMRTAHCLDPKEVLSPGQGAGIDRLYATYPEFTDDAFVRESLERWRS